MRSFTDLFIRRPVLAIVVNLVILIAGFRRIRSLNVRQYPRSDNAAVTVTTVYVGASADLVRGFITTPLERAIAAADGIDYIESEQHSLALSTITVRLKLNYDPNKRAGRDQFEGGPGAQRSAAGGGGADHQRGIGRFAVCLRLPELHLRNPRGQPDHRLPRARRFSRALTAIEGVQRADILGGRTFAMRIWFKPDRLAALDINPAQIREALAANNFLSAVGRTKGSLVQVNLTANTDLRKVEEFRKLVVRRVWRQARAAAGCGRRGSWRGGLRIGSPRFSGERAVFMGVWVLAQCKLTGRDQARARRNGLIQKELPTGLRAGLPTMPLNTSRTQFSEVLKTLSETLLIVAIVIFLFLGSLRSVLVPLVAIPISLIGAVFLMQVFGFTLNLLTLLAIVLSVGLVVDDAIVIVENVERHMREGKTPVQRGVARRAGTGRLR